MEDMAARTIRSANEVPSAASPRLPELDVSMIEEEGARLRIATSELTLQPAVLLGNEGSDTVHRGRWRGVDVACIPIVVPIGGLESEMMILTNLRHPNIVNIYDVCHTTEAVLLVTEYCPHGSLRSLLAATTTPASAMPLSRRIQLLMDVAAGLEYLHSRHITHGDVKPDNVLIGKDNCAKVSDFGGSAVTSAGESVTAHTVRWSAPEVVVEVGAVSYASDVWSFGLVCLEVITGHAPFPTLHDEAAVDAILRTAYEHPDWFKSVLHMQGFDDTVSSYTGVAHWLLMNVVDRCCLFNRDERPTMREVHTLLKTALSEAVRTESPPATVNTVLSGAAVTSATSTAPATVVTYSTAKL